MTVISNTTLPSCFAGSSTLGTIDISTSSKRCDVRIPNPIFMNAYNQRWTSPTTTVARVSQPCPTRQHEISAKAHVWFRWVHSQECYGETPPRILLHRPCSSYGLGTKQWAVGRSAASGYCQHSGIDMSNVANSDHMFDLIMSKNLSRLAGWLQFQECTRHYHPHQLMDID